MRSKKHHKSILMKIQAIEYLGCKCEGCGLSYPDEPYVIFDFHHRDPKDKKYDWKGMSKQTKEVRQSELDKCALLCANCHRKAHHDGYIPSHLIDDFLS